MPASTWIALAAAIVGGLSAIAAARSARKSQRTSYMLARQTDFVGRFDTTIARYRGTYETWRKEAVSLSYFGGHISARTLAARAEGSTVELLTELEDPLIVGLPASEELTASVKSIWASAYDLWQEVVRYEEIGNYRDGFRKLVFDRNSEWNKRREDVHGLLIEAESLHKRILKQASEARKVSQNSLWSSLESRSIAYGSRDRAAGPQ